MGRHLRPGTAAWQPGEQIIGIATLTVTTVHETHQNEVTVSGEGQYSHIVVGDDDPYNAFTGAIQLIKYDGEKSDPAVKGLEGAWITPLKPLVSASQDANTRDTAVKYPVDTAQRVRWVATNTAKTSLTNIRLFDETLDGPAIGDDWTADLSPFGGPSNYSFTAQGPWQGILPPGASFFAQGTLTLAPEQAHADNVTVIGTVVVPAPNEDGTPSKEPLRDGDGNPVKATRDGEPFDVSDDDPFHAWTGIGPWVDIEKGDGTAQKIENDADTMPDGQFYEPGETREIVFDVTNTGDEPLREVVLTEQTLSGELVSAPRYTMPDGTVVDSVFDEATGVYTARWEATFGDGTAAWRPGDKIYGTAQLQISLAGLPHLNRATVQAKGQFSGKPVRDEDDYNAFSAGIQVIKYDGNRPDPAVKDGEGNWIVPQKPLVSAAQDANTAGESVLYEAGKSNKVRWVVTNTGTTWLSEINLADATNFGPAIGDDWVADLSAFGGPAAYNFVSEGTWHGLIPPGASFFAEGTLKLDTGASHGDTVTVTGTPVVPATTEGVPNGEPQLDDEGKPVLVLDKDGKPVVLTDDDPFHAKVPLAVTGGQLAVGSIVLLGAALIIGGLVLLHIRRRKGEDIPS